MYQEYFREFSYTLVIVSLEHVCNRRIYNELIHIVNGLYRFMLYYVIIKPVESINSMYT